MRPVKLMMLLSSNNALEEDIEELRVIDYNCKAM